MSWKRTSFSDGLNFSKNPTKTIPKEKSEEGVLRHWRASFKYWFSALADTAKGKSYQSDIIAGITVSAVALPLNIALAIAAGLPATAGIISGFIGGVLAAFLGGSRWQVTGPAAALNIMVFAIVQQYGYAGAALAAFVTGVFLLAVSFFGLGKLISRLPEAVIAGFTTGVGLKLLDQQLPHLFGINLEISSILMNWSDPSWLTQVSWFEVLSGLCVIFLVLSFKTMPKIPGALLGLALITFISTYLKWDLKRVGTFSSEMPSWAWPSIDSSQTMSFLLMVAPLAILAAVESLLSARVADRMAGAKREFNSTQELFGQGVANIVVGLFGGMTVTGVVVRSSVNIQSGAKSRIAAITHGLVLFACMAYFSKYIAMVPIAALAGLLCLIGFRLVEIHHFVESFKKNKFEAGAFLIAAIGTVNDKLFLGLVGGVLFYAFFTWIHEKMTAKEHHHARHNKPLNQRAEIKVLPKKDFDWRVEYTHARANDNWIQHVDQKPQIHQLAYVHPNATVIGKVIVDRKAHIAAETSIRADEGTPFFIGQSVNLQDGVVLHALKDKFVRVNHEKWAIYIDEKVSVAHQALVHGPCFIGEQSFIGFKSIVHDSVVGSHCFIGHGAVVVGVEIPDNRFIPHGAVVDSQEKVDQLPHVSEAQMHFNEDVVEVNEGLSHAYHWNEMKEKLKLENNSKENQEWNSTRSQASSSDARSASYL